MELPFSHVANKHRDSFLASSAIGEIFRIVWVGCFRFRVQADYSGGEIGLSGSSSCYVGFSFFFYLLIMLSSWLVKLNILRRRGLISALSNICLPVLISIGKSLY